MSVTLYFLHPLFIIKPFLFFRKDEEENMNACANGDKQALKIKNNS
jgi:hypothetical protein